MLTYGNVENNVMFVTARHKNNFNFATILSLEDLQLLRLNGLIMEFSLNRSPNSKRHYASATKEADDDDDDELFCGIVDRRKAFSRISSWGYCQRSLPSQISDTPRAGFEHAQNLSSGLLD